MDPKEPLTKDALIEEAKLFCMEENKSNQNLNLDDGKSIGTFIEHNFKNYLKEKYTFNEGNSALGIDFPDSTINTDIKSTSIVKPQSSCPYRNPKQKIYGLGYSLLIFTYEKKNTIDGVQIKFLDISFIDESKTGDYTITKLVNDMLDEGCNKNDIINLLRIREISDDTETLNMLSDMIISKRPNQGYLTISNAMQLRLKYTRITDLKEKVDGIRKIKLEK